ncbi:MAG: hypothetical protein JXQ99_24780 [Hyphomicrobiaceae bacterium]
MTKLASPGWLCKLCRIPDALRRSHLLAAAFYKIVTRQENGWADHPVKYDSVSETALYSNDQLQQHLLCDACEDRLKKYGEDTVTRQCWRAGDKFRLKALLQSVDPHRTPEGDTYWDDSVIGGQINIDSYRYFALSVLWRASVVRWPGATANYNGALGQKYSEQFRNYLIHGEPFPKNVIISIFVEFDSAPLIFMTSPQSIPASFDSYNFRSHSFVVPGLMFQIFVGRDAERWRENARLDIPKSCVFYPIAFRESEFVRSFGIRAKGADLKGKLRREWQ